MWEPLLTGSIRGEAIAAVEGIAHDLRCKDLEARDYSYAGGLAGMALFLAEWASIGGLPADRAAALRYLERAWLVAEAEPRTLGLFPGLTGLVTVARAISELLSVWGLPEGVEEVDAALMETLGGDSWSWQYDLTYGLGGLGLYAALHPNGELACSIGDLVVGQLAAVAVEEGDGVRWRTPRQYRPLARRDSLPEDYCDLGVAHGIAGLVGALARLDGIVEGGLCRQLLNRSVSFLLQQKRKHPELSKMPAFVPDNGEDCRSAWCYGDVGVGAVLIGAGLRVREEAWAREGEAILVGDARRDMKNRRIGDCSVCHGGAGVAHLYARAYAGTRIAALRNEALRWYRWTLDQRREGIGIGGFLGWVSERQTYEPFAGLLVGSAGVGLALASALDFREPTWDRPLLVD